MAEEQVPKKKPGKLKFNPNLINLGGMKPGAKHPGLEAKRKRQADQPTEPLQTTENAFSRPERPKRRSRSKNRVPLPPEDDIKSEEKESNSFYNKSLFDDSMLDIEVKEDDAPSTDTNTNTTTPTTSTPNQSEIGSKLDSVLKDRKSVPESLGYKDPSKISPVIQENLKKLEQQKKADDIKQRLTSRQDIDEMLDSGVMVADPRKVASALASTHNELGKGLQERVDDDYLYKTQILKHKNIDASIQPQADDLQKRLESRPITSPVADDHAVPIANALAANAKSLKKQMASDKLNKSLQQSSQSSLQSLQQQGVIPTVDPVIAATSKQLEQQLKSDKLSQSLTDNNRPTQQRLKDQGVLPKVDPSIAATQRALDQQLKSDKLSQSLNEEGRPDLNTLKNQGVVPKVDPSIASTAVKLEVMLKTDTLSKELNKSRETTPSALEERGFLKYPDLSPNLADTANQLEHQKKGDKLKANLAQRPGIDELHRNNIIDPKVAPQFAANKRALEQQQKTDQIRQKLNSENRPDREELENNDILYSRTMAPSLQFNAKELEPQIRAIQDSKQSMNDDDDDDGMSRTSSPSNEQSPTATDEENDAFQTPMDVEAARGGMDEALAMRTHKKMEKRLSKPYAPIGSAMDNDGSITKKTKTRKLTADFLEEFLENRFDVEEVAERGLLSEPLIEESIIPRKQIAKKLDRRLSERKTVEDLESRHVIPKSYFDDPNKAYKDRQKSRKETRRTLKRRLHKERRPSVKDLEAQNIVPRDYFATDNDGLVTYFEDPQRAKEQRKRTKKAKKRALKHRLDKMRRPSRTDLENKHIVPSSGYFDDPQTASDKRRKSLEDKKERIRAHHKARPSIADLKAENIMPEDHEVIAELKNIAQKHQRMESAVKDLSNRLPFEAETNDQVAKTMMQHINDTEADIHLTGSTLSDEEDGDSDVSSEEEYGDGTRGSEQEESSRDPDIDYDASSDIEQTPSDGIKTFDLETYQKQNHKRRLSQSLDIFLKNKPNAETLAADGILKQHHIANSLRGAAVDLEKRINDQPSRKDLLDRQILKRPSISRSLQPNAEALEMELLRNLAKYNAQDMDAQLDRSQPTTPLFMTDSHSNKSNASSTNGTWPRRGGGGGGGGYRGHRRKNSGFGTSKNANPEYYRHDIAPKLQAAANRLHKKRVSQTISAALISRPTKEELVDQRILYKENMAHQLQGNAMKLEEQLKQRVPEQYLQMIGVLMHQSDQVAPRIQKTYHELEHALRRRPSLFDGAITADMIKILNINHNDNTDPNHLHSLYVDKLHDAMKSASREREIKFEDSIKGRQEEGLTISAFDEIYPDAQDKDNYRQRREWRTSLLERRMSLRLKPEDLERGGIVPKDYWEDPHSAVEMRQIQRKLAAEDLRRGLHNRSTREELVARGLTRAEYFEMDMDRAKKAIQKHSASTKRQIEHQLNSIFNPQLIELEQRGIVESGYFLTRAKQIEEGSRRKESVTIELQKKLLANPAAYDQFAANLVKDLGSGSDEEGGSDSLGRMDDDADRGDDEESEEGTSAISELTETDNGSGASQDDEDWDEFMDSDDEEQARRLQELEYKIGHRPSTDELIEKRILYKSVSEMAPAIQNAAKNLQRSMKKRKSIQDLNHSGILFAANQDEMDKSHVIMKPKKNKSTKRKRSKKEKEQKNALNRKLARKRRPTMMDLEIRGIVPQGYFEDAEVAMNEKKVRRENIIEDLTHRLASRPEFSEKLAGKLMSKAMESMHQRAEMVESANSPQGKQAISQILTAKMAQRMGFEELKSKNILPSNYTPDTSSNLITTQMALQKEQRKQGLASKINARPDVEELYDSGFMHYHHSKEVSHRIQPAAVELEERMKQRVDGRYLRKSGILYDSKVVAALESKMRRRPSKAALEQRAIVPHGAFDDLEDAKQREKDRRQSIQEELDMFLSRDRSSKFDLEKRNILKTQSGRRGSVEIIEHDDDDDDDDAVSAVNLDESDEDDIYMAPGSPKVPEIPDRPSSMFRSNTYTEVVMSSIAFNNKKAVEPSYEIESLVPEPDLDDTIMATSTLSFLNVVDNLDSLISGKIERAKREFIDKMQQKSNELQSLKNALRSLQAYGAGAVEHDGVFESIGVSLSGDIQSDIDMLWAQIKERQQQLFNMDNEYQPLHFEIKQLQNVKEEVSSYCDSYKMQLSQLKRVRQRISSYIEENEMVKESSKEAMRATDEQRAWMMSKITNKIAETEEKVATMAMTMGDGDEERAGEMATCNQFLDGLREFLKGLKKLRKSSSDRIEHFESIIEQLKLQQRDVEGQINALRNDAMAKLAEIRKEHLTIEAAVGDADSDSEDDDDRDPDGDADSELSALSDDDVDGDFFDDVEFDFGHQAPLSMLELMHKRERYMSLVYSKIGELEARASTTSSTDYLRGLTEIRELEMILNNNHLKYFYNHFVSVCNQIFNDCCLAQQAILENTAEYGTPLLSNLEGIQMLDDVLAGNRRKLTSSSTVEYLDAIVQFIQSLPDREVVIMQIARHLALSLPFRSFIVEAEHLRQKEEEDAEEEEDSNHLIKIDKFITSKIREWMGSILNIYGNSAFSSVRVALENDVVAQVRPSHAARLIVNCVYGLDVSL